MKKRITQKTFSELEIREHFWLFYEDVGEPDVERIKTSLSDAEYVKYIEGESNTTKLIPAKFEVWTVEYCGWWDYLWRICVAILVLLIIAFGFYYALWGK
jgi:hypothetical protein